MKFSTTRRGIKMFTDFYATTMVWSGEEHPDVRLVFEHTRKQLLWDVAQCVWSELRHYKMMKREKVFGLVKPAWANLPPYYDEARHRQKNFVAQVWRKNHRNYFEKARSVFLDDSGWNYLYGGPAWAEICRRAQLLQNTSTKTPLREMMVSIDMVIDSAHNTGRCLDKLYKNVNWWLTEKTHGTIDDLIMREAQPFVKSLRRLREYGV